MKSLLTLIGSELSWHQPRALKLAFELKHGEEVVARLHFPKFFSHDAIGESADGCWRFRRRGFLKRRFDIFPCNDEMPVATLIPDMWERGGQLELANGRRVHLSSNWWKATYTVRTDSGETLLEYTKRGIFKAAADVRLHANAKEYAELPWIVMLVWYLILLARRRAAHASA
jgi:hypothetical protein